MWPPLCCSPQETDASYRCKSVPCGTRHDYCEGMPSLFRKTNVSRQIHSKSRIHHSYTQFPSSKQRPGQKPTLDLLATIALEVARSAYAPFPTLLPL
jgi:hypothetical protein